MKKFENFKAALVNLNDIFSYKEPYGNVEIAGMVGLYEICFEQSWKAMKELLENFGYAEGATGSPRTILKTAYKAGMISDEELWLDALVSRIMLHTHIIRQLQWILYVKPKKSIMICLYN